MIDYFLVFLKILHIDFYNVYVPVFHPTYNEQGFPFPSSALSFVVVCVADLCNSDWGKLKTQSFFFFIYIVLIAGDNKCI